MKRVSITAILGGVVLLSTVNAAAQNGTSSTAATEAPAKAPLRPSIPDASRGQNSLINRSVLFESQNTFYFSTDLIYWAAREESILFAATSRDTGMYPNVSHFQTETLIAKDGKVQNLQIDWGAGFRVVAGYNLPFDGWDLYADYTRYHNAVRKNIKGVPGNFFAKPIFTNLWGPINGNIANALPGGTSGAKGEWGLHVDVIDLEVGCAYWIGKSFSVRPSIGLKNAWIYQHCNYFYPDSINISQNGDLGVFMGAYTARYRNNFWGLGPRAGLDTSWWLSKQWSIFGNMAASLLYGRFHIKQTGRTAPTPNPFNFQLPVLDMKDIYNTLKPVVEFSLGLRWETDLSDHRYHLTLDAAWEHQLWFHQNQLATFITAPATYQKAHGNLGLSGLTAGARFDF